MNKTNLEKIKVAIVYDRVNKFGGAERILLTLQEMFPTAPLYTSVYDEKNAPWAKVFPKVYTSFLQNIPFAKSNHELFGWLMPIAFEGFDFREYDLVISVTSEAAKGIITNTNTPHVCYMLTPTRYLWSGYDEYFESSILKFISNPILNYLKWWDKVASTRPDKIIAISTEVQKRIKKYYGRESEIIFPPVNLVANTQKSIINNNYYLYVGRLVKYKKVDLLVDTFNELKLPLVIVGVGSELNKLKLESKNNIKFLGNISDEELVKIYQNALGFLMPQDEDFGITSVEAQSFGIPVIAYKSGGALDTVIDGITGIFFEKQDKESLKQAISKFDNLSFNSGYLVTNAKRFGKDRFKKELFDCINKNIK
ncbi:MAG: glycosyl transferase group 1 [uncultured bacterium]|nr:MAG: glycosyl transferase group 1 [uncultured bacterium]